MKRACLLSIVCGILVCGSLAEGGTLFVVDDLTDSLYRINTVTGLPTVVGSLGADVSYSGLAFDTSDGAMYISDVVSEGPIGLGSVAYSTGELSFIGAHGPWINVHGLAYDPQMDALWGAELDQNGLVWIDREQETLLPAPAVPSPGWVHFVGEWGITTSIRGLAFDSDANVLYGIDSTSLYTIDRGTGAATLVGAHGIDLGVAYMSLEYDPDTNLMYAIGGETANLYTINTATATATLVGPTYLGDPSGLACIPNISPLYAVSDTTDSVWRIDPLTGAGSYVGLAGQDLTSSGMAYDSSTGTMYVTDIGVAPTPAGYGLGAVNTSSGAVTLVNDEFLNFTEIAGLAYDSLYDILWASDMDCYDIDGSRGGLAFVDLVSGDSTCINTYAEEDAGTQILLRGLAYNPNYFHLYDVQGQIYGIDGTDFYRVYRTAVGDDPLTVVFDPDYWPGEAQLLGAHGAGVGDQKIALEIDPVTGLMFGAGAQDGMLYVFNQRTGKATPVGAIGVAGISGMAVEPLVAPVAGAIFANDFDSGSLAGWSFVEY